MKISLSSLQLIFKSSWKSNSNQLKYCIKVTSTVESLRWLNQRLNAFRKLPENLLFILYRHKKFKRILQQISSHALNKKNARRISGSWYIPERLIWTSFFCKSVIPKLRHHFRFKHFRQCGLKIQNISGKSYHIWYVSDLFWEHQFFLCGIRYLSDILMT